MSENRASFDAELDAQLARMRELLKLMAREGDAAGALGATDNAAPADTGPSGRTRQRDDKPR